MKNFLFATMCFALQNMALAKINVIGLPVQAKRLPSRSFFQMTPGPVHSVPASLGKKPASLGKKAEGYIPKAFEKTTIRFTLDALDAACASPRLDLMDSITGRAMALQVVGMFSGIQSRQNTAGVTAQRLLVISEEADFDVTCVNF